MNMASHWVALLLHQVLIERPVFLIFKKGKEMKNDCALKKLALSKLENCFSSVSLIFLCTLNIFDQGITSLYSAANINSVASAAYLFLLVILIP